jgi:hypothetical protein
VRASVYVFSPDDTATKNADDDEESKKSVDGESVEKVEALSQPNGRRSNAGHDESRFDESRKTALTTKTVEA